MPKQCDDLGKEGVDLPISVLNTGIPLLVLIDEETMLSTRAGWRGGDDAGMEINLQ
jgi:hypothetical protein